MRIGILTSSRADYGIYKPLLVKLNQDSYFILEVIAFGSHLSVSNGFTVNLIEEDGFKTIHKISSLLSNDDEQSISTSYGLTALKFADFWKRNSYDLVFCLGDRFEMSAAVQAGIPFGIKFAHIHGGETTLGAFDNIYRHQISLASFFHFTAASQFTSKVLQLIGDNDRVHTVGALSLDGVKSFLPIEKKIFYEKYSIPNFDFVLITFHPETILPELNFSHANEMRKALEQIATNFFLVITMPNADTMGSIFRCEIEKLKKKFPTKVLCVENFGKQNYFSAMYYCKFLIGNTSSGILEAASFGKYVVNVGDRQKGRLQSENVRDAEFKQQSIIEVVSQVTKLGDFNGENKYYQEGASLRIIEVIKKYYNEL